MAIDKAQLGREITEQYDKWIADAQAGTLKPEDLEVWSSPACDAYTGTSDRNCVECPLEGPVCEAIQGAYMALYGHGDPAALLIGGKWLLARSLELWMDPVSEEVPT